MGLATEQNAWEDALLRSAPDVSLACKVLGALQNLFRDDIELLIRDVNERTITGKLADHLRPRFPGWDVDCEYNRDDHEVKKVDGRVVVPDIIVHRRGTPENLLVIEVKKSNTDEPDEEDLEKLVAFRTSHLSYRSALFVKLIVESCAPGVQRLQWV